MQLQIKYTKYYIISSLILCAGKTCDGEQSAVRDDLRDCGDHHHSPSRHHLRKLSHCLHKKKEESSTGEYEELTKLRNIFM